MPGGAQPATSDHRETAHLDNEARVAGPLQSSLACYYFDLDRGVQRVGEEDGSLESEAKEAVGLVVPGCVEGGRLGRESNPLP
jgi:hypothetical protein